MTAVARRLVLVLAALVGAAQPAPAQAGPPAIGATIEAELALTDIRYLRRRLEEFGDRRGFVLFFATVDCPMVNRYLPRIGRLAERYREHDLQFVVVNVGARDTIGAMAAQAVAGGVGVPFVRDDGLRVARALGVDRTTTAVVLGEGRRLHYRGRVDDQYRLGGVRPRATRDDLREALDDLVAARAARVGETAVEGCRITAPPRRAELAAERDVTFHRDVLPVLQKRCQSCHRDGGQAPFALGTFDECVDDAEMIVEVVEQGRMPPWYGAESAFVNYHGLTDAERDVLLDWAAGSRARGDAADAPPPVEWPDAEWRIGEPDLVLSVPTPIRLPADGYIPYRYFVLPYRFERDTWIEAIEIKPDNPAVLHHANLARIELGQRFSSKGFVTGYVPGGDAMVLDPGMAVKVRAGSALAIQAHYVTTGRKEVDRLRVGLRFPRVEVERELRVLIVGSSRFAIPPGAEHHEVRAKRRLRVDGRGLGLVAHMHLRGKDMTFSARSPDGSEETLLTVPNYSFDWQQSYRWSAPGRDFAAGTEIVVTAHYDNSAFNPYNPDPSTTVRYGLQTIDEMMFGFLFWTARDERLGLRVDPTTGHVVD